MVVDGEDLLNTAEPFLQGRLGSVFRLEVIPDRDAMPLFTPYGTFMTPL